MDEYIKDKERSDFMKRDEPIKHRIFIPRNGKLINIDTLSEEERKIIGEKIFTRLADCLMQSKGYERVKDDQSVI